MSSRKRCEEFARANNITFTMERIWYEYQHDCSVPDGLIIADEGKTGYSGEVWYEDGIGKAWQALLKDMKLLATAELITIEEYIANGGQA